MYVRIKNVITESIPNLDNNICLVNSCHSFTICFEQNLSYDVVDELIATLYYHPDAAAGDGNDAPVPKENARKKSYTEASTYSVTFKNAMLFWSTIAWLHFGRPCLLKGTVMGHHHIRTKNPYLVGLKWFCCYIVCLCPFWSKSADYFSHHIKAVVKVLHSRLQDMFQPTFIHHYLTSMSVKGVTSVFHIMHLVIVLLSLHSYY